MPSIAKVRAANSTFTPTYLPVAIFVGGTSGIGRASVEAFARYTAGNAHILIVGRNANAAAQILDALPKPRESSGWAHEFVECDASLLRTVHATVRALAARLPRINFLVLTAGYFSLGGREDTAEGLDRKLVLSYYARALFITGLIPALEAACAAGQPASALSVLAAGHAPAVDLDDLGLEKRYTGTLSMGASATYTDLMLEELAARHPTLALTHIFPGIVDSPLLGNSTHWASVFVKAASFFLAKSASDAAEYTLYGLFQARAGTTHHRGENGDELQKGPAYGKGSSAASRKVWAHTEEVVARYT
ncbi:NAD-P-binding protein [Mycena galericulata]|nr:NAD-P-binding protein [Mycena galericulata]